MLAAVAADVTVVEEAVARTAKCIGTSCLEYSSQIAAYRA
jgi:hypothetical protein